MEWELSPVGCLRGEVTLPGDKSISHRALILSGLASGVSRLEGLPRGGDVGSTADVMRALGVDLELEEAQGGRRATVRGDGLEGLSRPTEPLDCGNSGTTMRLVAGVLAGQPFRATLTGDASLRRRPMGRVAAPLRVMGATVETREDGRPPLSIGGGSLRGLTHRPEVASAQVKSCILLAGLYAEGPTTVVEVAPTRDHTERMLRAMGASVSCRDHTVELAPRPVLGPLEMRVPGDISSAAYLLVAAALRPGSDVLLRGVGVNPTRTEILRLLREWGAAIDRAGGESRAGEGVADLRVRGQRGRLRGGSVPPERVPGLIDELPLLGLLGPLTRDGVEVRGAAELRVKESDRIATTCAAIRALGGEVEEYPDGFAVAGEGSLRGGTVEAAGDHRIALAAAAVSVAAEAPVRVEGAAAADVSYPGFRQVLAGLEAGPE